MSPEARKDLYFHLALNIIAFMCRESDTKFSMLRSYDLLKILWKIRPKNYIIFYVVQSIKLTIFIII